jgi:isopenicillin-N epimerase
VISDRTNRGRSILPPKPNRFRRHWGLKPGTVFLNHGSFGACPGAILELQTRLRCEMEAGPVQFLWRRYEERLEPARRALAEFIGAKSRDVVFVTNATAGVNAVVRSLKFQRGDELLTTSLDYNACRNVLVEIAARSGAKLVITEIPFPVQSADAIKAAILRKVTSRTRLVMLDHVTSNSAVILPVFEIVRELEARGVDTLVDGAHAPGMLPLNLRKLRPAYYTANLHKWVCAPKGAAFLYVREDRQEGLQPAVISHGNNRPRPGFTPFQDRFDWAGTFDVTAWLCVPEAIRWMGELLPGGWRELRERNRELALNARKILCERWGVASPCPDEMIGSIAALPLPQRFQARRSRGKIDDEQLALYDRFGIEVPFNRFGNPERRWLRLSAQIYNSPADYEYLAEALNLL